MWLMERWEITLTRFTRPTSTKRESAIATRKLVNKVIDVNEQLLH